MRVPAWPSLAGPAIPGEPLHGRPMLRTSSLLDPPDSSSGPQSRMLKRYMEEQLA